LVTAGQPAVGIIPAVPYCDMRFVPGAGRGQFGMLTSLWPASLPWCR
jgi:hypothetical protein